jgi:hypothetical protein
VIPEQNEEETWGIGATDILPEWADLLETSMYAFIVGEKESTLPQQAIIIDAEGVEDFDLDSISFAGLPERSMEELKYSERIGSVEIEPEYLKRAIWTRRLIHLK